VTAKYDYIVDTGTISADTESVLEDVQEEWKGSLGQQLNVAASTPQGTMITGEVLARTSVMKNNAELANVINPNLSYGVFLDAVCSFLGIDRGANQSTVARDVQLVGNSQTSIQDGSRVQTPNGDIFVLVGSVTIPLSGSILTTFRSEQFGNIPLPVGPLKIIDGSIGWGAANVTASTVITPGHVALDDSQLKNARNDQLAIQGRGSSAAIKALASAVPNVTSVSVVENNTGVVGTVNGIQFTLPNAVWVCVAGTPTKEDLVAALWQAHQSGCPWDYGAAGNGVPVDAPDGTSVVDPATGLPYRVKYTTPVMFDAYVILDVQQGTSASSPVDAVRNSVLEYAKGEMAGEQGFVVGYSVSAFEIGGAVSRNLPGLYIKKVSVACVPAGSGAPPIGSYSTEFVLQPYQQAQIAAGNIQVNIV